MGVKSYYQSHGNEYRNPHEHLLKKVLSDLLCDQVEKIRSDTLTILDLSCGSGEGIVALVNAFKSLGIIHSSVILDISDPYTLPAFHEQRLINPLPNYVKLRNEYQWTFEELSHSDLMLIDKKYDIVISSFALHCN